MKIQNTHFKARKTIINKKDAPKHIFSFTKLFVHTADLKQTKLELKPIN